MRSRQSSIFDGKSDGKNPLSILPPIIAAVGGPIRTSAPPESSPPPRGGITRKIDAAIPSTLLPTFLLKGRGIAIVRKPPRAVALADKVLPRTF